MKKWRSEAAAIRRIGFKSANFCKKAESSGDDTPELGFKGAAFKLKSNGVLG